MSPRWPTRWRQDLLSDLSVPETQFALDVLSAWRQSTPMEPWTNNPLGLDAKKASRPHLHLTDYAIFPAMSDFRSEMVRLKSTKAGGNLVMLLEHGDKYSELWHAIRALNTPAKKTETDYPHRVADLSSKSYEETAPERSKGRRKTTGVVNPRPNPHHAMQQQARALHHAANHISDAAKGIEYIIRRMN